MTRDQTSDHRTITLEKFAKRVASAVGRFFDVSVPSPPPCPLEFFSLRVTVHRCFNHLHSHWLQEAEGLEAQDPNWRVGVGGITKDQVIVVGVVHVSQGSWQPILQLNRYVVPRRQHIPGLP
jgi:hypothetical protein